MMNVALLAAARLGSAEVLLGRQQVVAACGSARGRVAADRPLRVVLEAARRRRWSDGCAKPAAAVRDRVQRRRVARLRRVSGSRCVPSVQ